MASLPTTIGAWLTLAPAAAWYVPLGWIGLSAIDEASAVTAAHRNARSAAIIGSGTAVDPFRGTYRTRPGAGGVPVEVTWTLWRIGDDWRVDLEVGGEVWDEHIRFDQVARSLRLRIPGDTARRVERQIRALIERSSRRGARARSKDPPYREQTLAGQRAGYRAWAFWTGVPPEAATVGDAWAYVETPRGDIIAKRRFRTRHEAYAYATAALARALERAGIED